MTENKFSNTTPIIKHIVCSGGGVAGFTFYGILKEANKQGIWDIENIETMYGTSVGSIVNTILSLKYDWKDIDDYLMKRPWDMVYNVNMYSFFE